VEIAAADGECKTVAEGWGPKSKRRYPVQEVHEEKRPKINKSRTRMEAGLRGQRTERAKRNRRADSEEQAAEAAEAEPQKKRKHRRNRTSTGRASVCY